MDRDESPSESADTPAPRAAHANYTEDAVSAESPDHQRAPDTATSSGREAAAPAQLHDHTVPAAVTVHSVQEHYDRLSALYRTFWGEHIHHGLWSGNNNDDDHRLSPADAQVALIEELASSAQIPRGARVLDVGCGLGGSSCWLASHLGAQVEGITLSPAQRDMAGKKAQKLGLQERTRFRVQDANYMQVQPESLDVVWVIECSEHLDDKAKFIQTCHRALKPGGVLALCAWLAAEDLGIPGRAELVDGVCRGMLCPSLGRMSDYISWMETAGFTGIVGRDLTRRVERTWEICGGLLKRLRIDLIIGLVDPSARRFLESFELIRRAYAVDAMAYGLFVARKPELSAHS